MNKLTQTTPIGKDIRRDGWISVVVVVVLLGVMVV